MKVLKKKYQNLGFTLVELLTTVAIFFIIIGAIYTVHILSQRAYREGERAAEITQNGRVILERMVKEIRQAKAIAMEISEERAGSTSTIIFQDGHLSSTFEEGQVQGATLKTITLKSTASGEEDYYKDMFIIVIHPTTKETQTRKINNYDGATKVAEVEAPWDTIPTGWDYQIDSSYYYIHYYRDDQNNVWRRVIAYCFSENGLNCADPLVHVSWNAAFKIEVILEQPKIIGECVSQMEFWGKKIINIALVLAKNGKTLNLETKVLGRNL